MICKLFSLFFIDWIKFHIFSIKNNLSELTIIFIFNYCSFSINWCNNFCISLYLITILYSIFNCILRSIYIINSFREQTTHIISVIRIKLCKIDSMVRKFCLFRLLYIIFMLNTETHQQINSIITSFLRSITDLYSIYTLLCQTIYQLIC